MIRPGAAPTHTQKSQRFGWSYKLLWIAPLLFLALFYFYPLGSILKVSLARQQDGLLAALTSTYIRNILSFTFTQAALSTLLTLGVGLPGAYLLARFDFPGKGTLRALTAIPFVLPTIVVATAFDALLGPQGWVNSALMTTFGLETAPINFMHTLAAILIAHVFYNTTIVLRMVGDFWSHIDPSIQSAARMLGASPLKTLWHITLPMLTPVILAAALLIFIFDFTSFGVVLILGGPQFATLEVEIYYQAISLFNLPMAASLSILQLLFTLGLTIAYTRLAARVTRPIKLRPRTYTQRRLQGRQKIVAAIILFTLLVLLVAPMGALAARSFVQLKPERGQSGQANYGATLDFYTALADNPRNALFYASPLEAIRNSIAYALITVMISLALGLPAAWALAHDQQSRLNKILDPLLLLPVGTSAVTLGLGFIIALGRPPLDLRSSVLLIPLAHSLVAFPFVVRSLTPALRSIRPRLRQAAQMLGATPAAALRAIDLPLVGRSVLVAATFAFAISMGEFGATVIIARPEYPTLPMVIYRFLSRPGGVNYGQAMALSTILMLVTGGGIMLIERMRVADVGEF